MNIVTHPFRRHASHFLAIVIIVALYFLARQTEISSAERAQLASDFAFRSSLLPELPGHQQTIRTVNPSLRTIAGWISATGAAVALNDIDGDGLPNDLCLVDPRTDSVMVTPVPGREASYKPFALNAGALYRRSTMAPMGCLPADYNEDGLADLLVYYWGRTPIIFLARSRSSQTATTLTAADYKPQEIVTGGDRWYTGAATLADLDGDGHSFDVVIGNYYADNARILDGSAAGSEAMQHSMTRAFNAGKSRLLRWAGATSGYDPSVRYEVIENYIEGAREENERITRGWTLAIAAADLDGDLLPEIYFANDFGPDRLLHNRSEPGQLRFVPVQGVKTLTTPSSKVLGRDGFKGMGVDFGDINGDGLTDIYVSNIAEAYALEESHFAFINDGEHSRLKEGVAPFSDESEALGLSRSGWGWESKLGDFNNDGRLEALQATGFMKGETNCWPELHELAMGNDQLLERPGVWPAFDRRCGLSYQGQNPFFVQAKDGRFYDLAKEVGLDKPQISRGIATADVEGDGRLDYAVANQWEPSYYYHNQSPNPGAFLGLHLRLPLDNTDADVSRVYDGHPRAGTRSLAAIGAHVFVQLPDGRRLVSEVDGGNGHSGKRSHDLHFGLGGLKQETELPVEISWRDRSGKVNKLVLRLRPGWHTALLGGPEWRSGE